MSSSMNSNLLVFCFVASVFKEAQFVQRELFSQMHQQ
jgi:hypothetical protein